MPFDDSRTISWAPLAAVLMACAFEAPVAPGDQHHAEASDASEPSDIPDASVPSDSPDASVPSGPVVTAEEALEAWLRAVCAPTVPCGWMEKIEDCLPIAAGDATSNGIDRIVAAVEVDKAVLDEGGLARCLATMEARTCDAMMTFHFSAFSECRDLLVGSRPLGAACTSPFSCAPGLYCREAHGSECDGTCRPIEGSDCVRDDDCAEGRICHEFRCRTPLLPLPPLKVGDSCARRGEIGACGPDAKCLDGLCVAVRLEGETCSNASPCGPRDLAHHCIQKRAGDCGPSLTRLVCDPVENRCVKAPATGPCLSGEFCDPYEAWCDTTVDPPTCAPHRQPGDPCELNMECGAPFPANGCFIEDGTNVCWRKETFVCP